MSSTPTNESPSGEHVAVVHLPCNNPIINFIVYNKSIQIFLCSIMTNYIVVEKGELDSPTPCLRQELSQYCHIGVTKPRDSVLFPNVDSCLAIIIELDNDCRVVAHLGVFDPGFGDGTPTASINGQLEEIIEKIKDHLPNKLTLIGDPSYWDTTSLEAALISKNEDVDFDKTLFIGDLPALDISITDRGKIQITRTSTGFVEPMDEVSSEENLSVPISAGG